MNLGVSEPEMDSSHRHYQQDEKTDPLHTCLKRKLIEESMAHYPNGSSISQLLRKTIQKSRVLDQGLLYFSSSTLPTSTSVGSSHEERTSTSQKEHPCDPSLPHSYPAITTNGFEAERLYDEHLEAKRARVENIIRGMTTSPNNTTHNDVEKDVDYQSGCERESYRENKRKQKLPQYQNHCLTEPSISNSVSSKELKRDEECHKLKEQLQTLQRQIKQLQLRFFQVYDVSDQSSSEQENEDLDKTDLTSKNEETIGPSDQSFNNPPYINLYRKMGTEEAASKSSNIDKELNDSCLLSCEAKNFSETLKNELVGAVTQIVDSVLKRFSFKFYSYFSQTYNDLQASMSNSMDSSENKNLHSNANDQQHVEVHNRQRYHEYYQSQESTSLEDQTEALPLVVKKTTMNPSSSISPVLKRPYPLPQMSFPLALSSQHQENPILGHLLRYAPHANLANLQSIASPMDRSSPESLDLPWETVKLRSKIRSHHVNHQPCSTPFNQGQIESLCLPHVKAECGDLPSIVDGNLYASVSIQEGLTPSHLKKAKLMFFYTRYPSSSVLKMYFPDVKFNRCITSQLIKWFSNFREFYYIQMEKYARQAIVDGVTDSKELTVSLDSELFRALNMHYNKANDFEVPDRFLEVARITLQEFFSAILMGKDSDPSWKKSIYKVISKLDGEIPELFKSSTTFSAPLVQ
ncbi:prospero homeobox protein 2 [Latimeria chalumnae]|uniref:prospero homeobox protein 2 n=1 Tax=Latimeria chalumnae TaxID=7897 RepID=UPI0006D908C8|nr:PREDICTED: prospero homeobox protein 2 [Latimeria chalumnae]|eukprot:XP_005986696.2 PREDICTED: prospero homeobox protein 2 [Latimeria chalumnae]